ncbi:[Fe-Fe] hydrogenase large subunit C-terminal domain-containing protein [Sinanaerobacter chloroacetimidivorans]|jgi:iron only hydrogenase large subunit-like protein|uniref:Iron hydrogenase n=1 Tax=Sinanaerobacter chloroacetimidivorans TaxID=2818044 RepID=A0A8J7W772_9FIRM|nr:[Fe-Fe] hydrogenase large subunit C-terminal domain-containing protein [Sinanaerobacter chloroacetimidivorans]MBR0600390.1 iron hydrogenase [Sinanaerobacter chloroacetimidivorans]
MDDKYLDFNEKRMHIFGELVKRYWNGRLNTVTDLDELTEDIMRRYGFHPEEKTFIQDHIRLAMGLEPTGNADFREELDLVKSSREISKPVVAKIEGPCEYCDRHSCECVSMGKYETLLYSRTKEEDEEGDDDCLECGYCASSCDFGSIAEKIEFLPIVDLLKESKEPVFAAAAPAIVGQFGDNVTMGKLRTAFKMMGFEDMIEIALFADILTIKEAFEFNKLVKKKEDFFLTSCCCPVWFNMIKKNYPDIYEHLSPSISPMIASGRILKRLYPNAKVVFISPCIAKKSEALEPDLKGAIDYVINFRELQEIFAALEINLEELSPLDKDHASLGGRLYARKGGVSFSVKTVVNRLEPSRVIKLKAKKVDGVKECKAILDALSRHEDIDANFIEGMGCPGGCVGGPRTNIDTVKATAMVNEFGEDSFILTPFDNLNVMKILKQLGISSIEEITQNEDMKKLLSRE